MDLAARRNLIHLRNHSSDFETWRTEQKNLSRVSAELYEQRKNAIPEGESRFIRHLNVELATLDYQAAYSLFESLT